MKTPDPILIPARVACGMCNRSLVTWWRLASAGKTPAPVHLGGATMWKRQEILDWIQAGCPARDIWEAKRGEAQK